MKKWNCRILSMCLAITTVICFIIPVNAIAKGVNAEYSFSYEEYYRNHNIAIAKLQMGEEKTEILWPKLYLSNGVDDVDDFPAGVLEAVRNGMVAGDASVNISSYGIPKDQVNMLFAAVEEEYPIEYNASDFRYCSGISSYSNGMLASVSLNYWHDVAQRDYIQRYNNLTNVVDNIISKSDLTDNFTKTMSFHDYLVLNSQYDTTYSIYDAYTILVSGTGVCQAYSDSFRLLCNLTDVPCITVPSDSMNHAWNMVEIEDDWYHIDNTWDDPLLNGADIPGNIERTNMYHSDTSFETNCEHYEWESDQTADSEKFANMPRENNYKQFFANNMWYYTDGSSIKTCDRYGNNISVLLDNISSDSIGYYKGLLVYSNGKSIYTYNLATEQTECVYTMTAEESGDWPEQQNVCVKNISVSESGLVTYKCYILEADPSTPGRYFYKTVDGINTVQLVAPEPVLESIALDKTELNLEEGQQEQLSIIYTPDDASADTITWSTSNSGVATVDNGLVTAVGSGTAEISVNADGKEASCLVNVSKKSITLSINNGAESLSIEKGETVTLTAAVSPSVSDNTVTWSTTDSNIASVDSDGKVSGISAGTVTITATSNYDNTVSDTITVEVEETVVPGGDDDDVTDFTLTISADTYSIGLNETLPLEVSFSKTPSDDTVSWWITDHTGNGYVLSDEFYSTVSGDVTLMARSNANPLIKSNTITIHVGD